MAKQYWLKIEGQIEGPFPSSKIKEMAVGGRIPESAKISPDGAKYYPISAVRGLPSLKNNASRPQPSNAAITQTKPSAAQAPAGQAPAGQAPAGQAPAGQAPAGQVPAQPSAIASPATSAQKAEVSSGPSQGVKATPPSGEPTAIQDAPKPFDVFVSYRRGQGAQIAQLVKEKLERAGYSVFLDVEGLQEGSWADALQKRIEECTDFIPIVTDGFFDRCQDESDVVRRELELAVAAEKNIVPLLVAESPFPPDLPDTLSKIATYNGVRYTHEYVDDCMDKLRHMLKSGQLGLARLGSKELAPKLVVTITGCLMAMMHGGTTFAMGQGLSGLIATLPYLLMSFIMRPIYAIFFLMPVMGALFGASVAYKIDSNKLYCGREWIIFWLMFVPTITILAQIAATAGSVFWSLIMPTFSQALLPFVGMGSAFVAVGFFLRFVFKYQWWRWVLRIVPGGS